MMVGMCQTLAFQNGHLMVKQAMPGRGRLMTLMTILSVFGVCYVPHVSAQYPICGPGPSMCWHSAYICVQLVHRSQASAHLPIGGMKSPAPADEMLWDKT